MSDKPSIILATSNGVGMGHLARASAIAKALKGRANPVIVSMAGGVAEIPEAFDISCEYIPGKDRRWMSKSKWDLYLRDRLVALIDETNARILTFDGVVPYAGVIAARIARPQVKLVWIRRGLWQKKPHRFALPLQSRAMDLIIEPGDYAFAYDHGPTSKREDAIRTAPVSLYQSNEALDRAAARKILGLDPNRPTVLVQLGTGADDANEKMRAALTGLLAWPDLQVVLTKEPIDKNGKPLAPANLDYRVIRYFPLAKVLAAFDAGICATGYNGVHELLAAGLPTVFISNIRGMDDQEARAKWCANFGYALRADQANLGDITNTVAKLQDPALRNSLSEKCRELPVPIGGEEIADKLIEVLGIPDPQKNFLSRFAIFSILRLASRIYNGLRREKNNLLPLRSEVNVIENNQASELKELIAKNIAFEHAVSGSSENYKEIRKMIRNKYI